MGSDLKEQNMTSTEYQKLQRLLRELFRTNQADLDFGIYRVINQKRDEVNQFLDEDLLPQVQAAFKEYQSVDSQSLNADLQEAVKQAEDLGVEPDTVPKVKEIKEQMASYGVDVAELENQVYAALYNFFRRYYDKGDFISQRRYKEGVYAIPYEGEEVKLHWANHDQYYIKTSEHLRNYTFKLKSGQLAHVKLVSADTEKDNRKESDDKKRRFILADEPLRVEDEQLALLFEFRPDAEKRKQEKLNKEAVEKIFSLRDEIDDPIIKDALTELSTPAPTEKDKTRTLLAKHLDDYTRRNTQDYFIHKDLEIFLRQELDFFIKNEIMHLDDIESDTAPRVEQYLSKIKVIRKIAHKIIAFLAQIENFQKKLWLKKKFVVETNYCITLDRIPEELYPVIAANSAQREEWVHLFAIDKIEGNLLAPAYSEPLTVEFLKTNHHLTMDTIFFDEEFIFKLLSFLEDIDNNLGGVLINSENFQALHLLQSKHKNTIKSVYIDPPYNTDASSILYKNDYKNSSWLSLMKDRLSLSTSLIQDDGAICVAIDDEEVAPLRFLMRSNLTNQLGITVVRSNPAGRKTKGRLAPAHEYGLFFGKSDKSIPGSLPKSEKSLKRYPKIDEKGRFAWANFIRSGNNDKREDRPKLFYPIFVSEDDIIRIPEITWNDNKNGYDLLEQPGENEKIVLPIVIDDEGTIEKNWQRGHVRVPKELDEYRIRREEDGSIKIDFKTRMDEKSLPITWWDHNKYASANYGAAEMKNLFGEKIFDFAKAMRLVKDSIITLGADGNNDTVLDFFAGSGTSGHAVIDLNRQDQSFRKYILVEMGQYFDNTTKPRIQKVIYSEDWKDGRPLSRKGSSHAFKYLKLESYEDTLNNLELSRSAEQTGAMFTSATFREEYLLSYMLDIESQGSLLSIKSFETPFDYKLQIATDTVGETVSTKIDLVETFNYLIGLQVAHISRIQGVVVVEGTTRQGEKTLVIWRNIPDMDNEKLDRFFEKLDIRTRDFEYDVIYVNGDNNLPNLRTAGEQWKVRLIEEDFLRLMFDVEGI
jgi:adenine-specific DNA-methyltransferase